MKTTNCRVPSSLASSKTINGRTQELLQHRRTCSGGELAFQLGREVKACSKEEREGILEELQDGFKVQMPTNYAVALKADLGIPWSKLRAIRRLVCGHNWYVLTQHLNRWFKECKVSIPSEKVMRKRASEIIGDNLEVEKVALTFPLKSGGEEIKMRPFGYIPDLWSQVLQFLENNERYATNSSISIL